MSNIVYVTSVADVPAWAINEGTSLALPELAKAIAANREYAFAVSAGDGKSATFVFKPAPVPTTPTPPVDQAKAKASAQDPPLPEATPRETDSPKVAESRAAYATALKNLDAVLSRAHTDDEATAANKAVSEAKALLAARQMLGA